MSQSKIQKETEKKTETRFFAYRFICRYTNLVIFIFFQWMFDTGITFGKDLNLRVQEELLEL